MSYYTQEYIRPSSEVVRGGVVVVIVDGGGNM